MQAQATRRLREYRVSGMILGAIAGLGILVAVIVGTQALTGEDRAPAGDALSPAVFPVQHDPPLPEGWIDPTLAQPAGFLAEDPPLPEGWVDPYFRQAPAQPLQEDPPLPEGWVDPYLQCSD